MSIEGISLNGSQLPTGRVQRATPRFARPSIDLDAAGTRVRRDWRSVPVADIAVDDNVPGLGLIVAVESTLRQPDPDVCGECGTETPALPQWTVTLTGAAGLSLAFDGSDSVYAFTAGT